MNETGQTVCLFMIVKDEVHVLRRCLESVRPHIDQWAIIDTGSTDGTQDLVREVYKDLPGVLVERPWKKLRPQPLRVHRVRPWPRRLPADPGCGRIRGNGRRLRLAAADLRRV